MLRILALAGLSSAIVVTAGRGDGFALASIACSCALGLALQHGRFARFGLWPPALVLAWQILTYAAQPLARTPYLSLGAIAAAPLGVLIVCLPRMSRPGLARSLGRASCILVVLLAGAISAEYVAREHEPRSCHELRAIPGSASSQLYAEDDVLGHRMRPRFLGRFVHPEYGEEILATNERGYRDREWDSTPRVSSARPILMLGDSMVLGLGVEQAQTVSAVLESELRARSGRAELIVRNTAVAGYGLGHHRLVLEAVLPVLRPQVVVLCFYDGNDLEDEALLDARRAPNAAMASPTSLGTPAAATPPLWTRRYWFRASSFYRRIEMELAPFLASRDLPPPDWVYNEDFLRSMAREPDAEIRRRFELARSHLFAVAERCREHDARLVFVRLPAKLQVEREAFAELLRFLGRDPARFDVTLPGSAMLASASAAGSIVVDLLPALAHPAPYGSPCYYFEGHLRSAGHRVVAEQLAAPILGCLSGPR